MGLKDELTTVEEEIERIRQEADADDAQLVSGPGYKEIRLRYELEDEE